MTRQGFLDRLLTEVFDRYGPEVADRRVADFKAGKAILIDSAVIAAWKAVGGRGKPSLAALRSLR